MSLLHSQSGLALVLSLLLLMVINYYYPATQSTADVMSPMSLGQREKKKAGCPSWGRLLAAGGVKREGFCRRLRCDGVWQEPWLVSAANHGLHLRSFLLFQCALMCAALLPAAAHVLGQGVIWLENEIKIRSPCCLPLSPNFG